MRRGTSTSSVLRAASAPGSGADQLCLLRFVCAAGQECRWQGTGGGTETLSTWLAHSSIEFGVCFVTMFVPL